MTDTAQQLRRRWLYVPYAVAGIILIAYFFLWQAGAGEMKKAITAWADDQREMGIDVQYDALKSDGFPFFLRVHVEAPRIETQDQRYSWYTERLSLDALPYDLNKLIFSTQTEQFIHVDGYGDWAIRAKDFRVSIANDKTHEWKFAATIGHLNAHRQADDMRVNLGSLLLDLSPEAGNLSTLTLSLATTDLNREVKNERLDLGNMQTVIALTKAEAVADADLWRHAGGQLIISGLKTEIQQSKLSVAGQLSLDNKNQPTGQLNTEIIAPAPFITTLGKLGLTSEKEAEKLAAALTLTAIAGGGKIAAPIILNDGKAQIAGAKIADLPRFD
ncbi:DUF2125 domain-containing protein [Hyphococcus lacteus]|uniref:DUF2125 domain-containing protein n=1 Tax=Hyphococcus lacteus TaxID=3143536 RepID=A0ABV3Z2G6_9PROT